MGLDDQCNRQIDINKSRLGFLGNSGGMASWGPRKELFRCVGKSHGLSRCCWHPLALKCFLHLKREELSFLVWSIHHVGYFEGFCLKKIDMF
jgi:hypothetical protein